MSLPAANARAYLGPVFSSSARRRKCSATKNENFNYERSSLVSLSTTARTPDGGSSGYFLRNPFDVNKLDVKRVAQEAIRKALEGRRPRTLEAGVYPAILEPQAVADLLSFFAFSFDARSAERPQSFFVAGVKRKLEKKCLITDLLYSDPWTRIFPDASSQAGIPAQRIQLVRNGVLEHLTYSRYWAKQKDKQPTPGPVNSIMESSAPTATLEEMISGTERGILLGRFWYIRGVDPRTALQTGLTRDGIWYIEGGEIQYPVKNFRFNQSLMACGAGNGEMIGCRPCSSGRQGNARRYCRT